MTEPTHDSSSNSAGNSAPTPTAEQVIRRLGPAAVLAAMAAFLPALGGFLLLAHIDTAGQWLRSHGQPGVALYIGGFAVAAGLALLPTYASAILGGWAFGFATGLPAALGGFLGGSFIGYIVARPAASDRVTSLIAEQPKWEAVRRALVGGSALKTLGIVTLLRLPPNSPFAMTNLILTSVKVRMPIYLLGTFVGMLPRTAIVVYLASRVRGELASEAATGRPWWWIPVGIGCAVVVLGIIGIIAKRALARATRAAAPPGTPPATPG